MSSTAPLLLLFVVAGVCVLDSAQKFRFEKASLSKVCGWASIACNFPFIAFVVVGPDECHPTVATWAYITTGLLGFGVPLAIVGGVVGAKRWAFAAIAPPLVFVAGATYLLLNPGKMICW